MQDGVRLSARLWLPELANGEQVPAILEFIPYRKRDMVRLRDQRNHPYFAQNGYVSIRVDMRGSGDSEGVMRDMYCAEELNDAIEVIEWISHQPWCNGRVGMMGTSWGGTSSLQAASRRPEALRAVIAVCANNNRFDDDIHHMGGCLLTDTVEWGATLPAILASPPDPETVGPRWRENWQQRLEQMEFPLENWVRHESRGQYWRWGSVNEVPGAIICPVLMIGGWADRYSNTVMNFLEDSHDQCWGIVGPWGHQYPDQGSPGPGINFQHEALRWWNHWLKGEDTGVDQEPRLRVWMQTYSKPENLITARPGRWIGEATWPSENTKISKLFLDNENLVADKPETNTDLEVPWSLEVGNAAGDTGYFGRSGGLPLDQRADDDDSLVFQSDCLNDPMEILGSALLKIILTATTRPATVVARLNDVHPDGSIARVCYAVRNLALDHNGDKTNNSECDSPISIELEFPNTAYQFAIGHQIRIAISSSYWPVIWPSPAPTRMGLCLEHAELQLPTRVPESTDAQIDFIAPVKPDGLPAHKVISAPALERWTEYDQSTGEKSICWHQPYHRIYHKEITLEFGFEMNARHHINVYDPNSASSRFQHELSFKRDGQHIKVNCSAELRSTKTEFLLYGVLAITENEKVIFHKEWQPVVTRTCS